jgi:hypothetical protein
MRTANTKGRASTSPTQQDFNNVSVLGFEIGGSAAEQWPRLRTLERYRGVSMGDYMQDAAKSCASLLNHPALMGPFEEGFMLGFMDAADDLDDVATGAGEVAA